MRPKVFVGSSREGLAVAEAVQKELSHETEAILWSQGIFRMTNVAIEDLMAALNEFDFAVFVFLPEDTVTVREQVTQAVRDNVLFELGMFLGKLGRQRNFFVTPRSESKTELHLPSDLSGITPAKYDPKAKNLQAAVGAALYEVKQAIRGLGSLNKRQVVLYESATDFKPYHFEHRGGYFWRDNQKISPQGEGLLDFLSEGILRVQRKNAEGRYEIELRRAGPDMPSITKKHEPPPRILRIACDAKVDAGEHAVRFVLKDIKTEKWVGNTLKQVSAKEWTPLEVYFRVPSTADLLFRIDVEKPSIVPSNLYLRNLMIAEEE